RGPAVGVASSAADGRDAMHALCGDAAMRTTALVPLALVVSLFGRPVSAATYDVDGAKSSLRVLVGKTGALKAFGHVHEILATGMSGSVVADPDHLLDARVTLTFGSADLKVDATKEPKKDAPAVQAAMEKDVLAIAQ